MEHHDPNCIFCFRDDELIEMDSNSVQIGSEIIDFSDLINDVMQGLKVLRKRCAYSAFFNSHKFSGGNWTHMRRLQESTNSVLLLQDVCKGTN